MEPLRGFPEGVDLQLHRDLVRTSAAMIASQSARDNKDPYGDSDQSPVPGPTTPLAPLGPIPELGTQEHEEYCVKVAGRQQMLRAAYATGLDLGEELKKIDSFPVLCYKGDLQTARVHLAAAREKKEAGDKDALKRLLERRCSLLKMAPLHMCLLGAKRLAMRTLNGERRYYKMAHALLDAGARVDPRDLIGQTPLSIAVTTRCTPETVALVPLLVRFGANVNAVSRFGEGLLTHAIVDNNIHVFKVLMQAGANLDLKDPCGLSPRLYLEKMPNEHMAKEIEKATICRNISVTLCEFCGIAGAIKRCSHCKKVHYCEKGCQRKDWKRVHKTICTAASSGTQEGISGNL